VSLLQCVKAFDEFWLLSSLCFHVIAALALIIGVATAAAVSCVALCLVCVLFIRRRNARPPTTPLPLAVGIPAHPYPPAPAAFVPAAYATAPPPPPYHTAPPPLPSAPQVEKCPVCWEAPKTAAMVPCGHTLCRVCAQRIVSSSARCPICRGAVTTVLPLF
jgi:hypothetical protein